jgi:hypothetical protein
VAAVANDGIVTASGVGETTIMASIGPIRGATLVHVRRVTVASVEVFPPTTTLQVADHVRFDGTPYDADGNALPGRLVRWASENNSVASVDQTSGDVTASPRRSRSVVAERLAIAQQPFAFFSEIVWWSSNRIPRRSLACLRET